jgi:transposase
MRLSKSVSPNATSLYVIKSVIVDGKRTSKIVEKLGTLKEIEERLGGRDPIEWANEHVARLNEEEKAGRSEVTARFSPSKTIPMGEEALYDGGYLFLQKIYHEIGLDRICSRISEEGRFSYDLNSVLSRLIYTRILHPSSKLSSYESSKSLIEPPAFELHHVYRALEVLARESDMIESQVYLNSLATMKRNTRILYYDCTNYYFEIESQDGIRQYGLSKENRPNPIVQMGLFMDGDGLPLAFTLNPGNSNEQLTLKPIEKRIMSDFGLSKFIICADAGLSSTVNRKYNSMGDRAYVVTQSVKKLKAHLKEWALSPDGWSLEGRRDRIRLDGIDESSESEAVYFKERWIVEDGLEQRLIVTYSPKHKAYQRAIREEQLSRAAGRLEKPSSAKRRNQNDPARFISSTHCTEDGEVASREILSLDMEAYEGEQIYDGFYGICTNLESDPRDILRINRNRWEIEETFRILKSEFKARPVYLNRDDRIKAHFLTCFLSLLVYRVLEKKLGNKFTCEEITGQLRKMQFWKLKGEGYVPAYKRTDLTDALHDSFGFRTDSEIVDQKRMKNILKMTKK